MSRAGFYKSLDLVKSGNRRGIREEEVVSQESMKRSIQAAVGRRLRGFVDDEFMEQLGKLSGEGDENVDEYMRDNFIEWIGVMQGKDGSRVGLSGYIDAVRYCSWRLLGETAEVSFRRVFKEKCAKVEERYGGESEASRKERVCWLARAYDKSKLVVEIMRQSLVPSWILNAPYYQEALNALVRMVRDDEVRGMAKVKACEAILEATKQPEEVKVSIGGNVGVKNEAMEELRGVVDDLCRGMKEQIEAGKSLREISEIELVKGEDDEYSTGEEDTENGEGAGK